MREIYQKFINILEKHGQKKVQLELNVNKNTINRWLKLEKIPSNYFFDLCRIEGEDVDYTKFTEKEKDQFFTDTSVAKECLKIIEKVLNKYQENIENYMLIEPSAGDGSFFNLLPKTKRIGIDIEPKCNGVIQTDFLKWTPNTKNNITLGNPPFGLRGHLALKFINHASNFSDYVCFILPQLFESNGKGSCKKRVEGLNLIHTEKIGSKYYYPSGKEVNVNVVFQIWSKKHKIDEISYDVSDKLKIYSLSDGGTPGTTRNKNMIGKCDFYLPSTCFKEENVSLYNEFELLPQRRGYGLKLIKDTEQLRKLIYKIDWKNVFFKSTNGAFNLRSDLISNAIGKQMLQKD